MPFFCWIHRTSCLIKNKAQASVIAHRPWGPHPAYLSRGRTSRVSVYSLFCRTFTQTHLSTYCMRSVVSGTGKKVSKSNRIALPILFNIISGELGPVIPSFHLHTILTHRSLFYDILFISPSCRRKSEALWEEVLFSASRRIRSRAQIVRAMTWSYQMENIPS